MPNEWGDTLVQAPKANEWGDTPSSVDASFENQLAGGESLTPEEADQIDKVATLKGQILKHQELARAYTAKAGRYGGLAAAVDLPGAIHTLFQGMYAGTGKVLDAMGLPDYRTEDQKGEMPNAISPEQVGKVAEFLNPFPRGTLPQDDFTQGIQEGLKTMASGLTSLENLSLMAVAKEFPGPVGAGFAGTMVGDIPAATEQLITAKTPRERGEATVRLVANVVLPKLIQKGLEEKRVTPSVLSFGKDTGVAESVREAGAPLTAKVVEETKTDLGGQKSETVNVPPVESPAPVTIATLDRLEAEGKTPNEIQKEQGPPKLRAGEKATGDLFQGEDAPFNLAGETAVDTERVAREKADAAKKAAEAKAAQEKQQPGLPLGITPGGQQAVKLITEKLSSLRAKLVNSWATRGNKADIARLKDAADNQARIDANQHGESVRLEARRIFGSDATQAQRAVFAVIEAAGDRNRLNTFGRQAHGKDLQAEQAARFAQQHWDRLQPLAAKIKAIHDAQIAEENANGIATEYRENYIKHAFDVEKLPNRGEEFFGSGGGAGARSGFKAARKFETIYDAIEAGYGKAIKSMDAAKLVESRLASGQQLINDRQWVNGFRGIVDPTTNKPLITDVTFDRNHFPIAPAGYDVITPLPGQFLAVHNGYGKIFRAVTDPSKIAEGEIAGLPVGQAVLSTAAGIKHGLLLFDTFHASRIMQKQFFLTGKKPSWNKGLSLLEYTDADLNEAVRQGEITTEMATYARANRGTAQLLMREGLNVGRIQEALRSEIVRNLPVVGTFNKWVFDKVTRGAMMESALIEFERTQANNPAMTPQQVAATVAKKINVTFGNIGRQGLFKSRTFQDLSRLVALAPQWVESMARSEIGGFKELGKVPVDLALGKGLQVGTLGKTMAGGLLAYFVGTQLINLATRGQLTFQNKEDGHRLDAWIPDLTGKTPGFFLNPLSVVAELTHDAYRYAFKKDSAIDVAKEILGNKASPLARSQYTFWSGKNFAGEKIDGTWNRIKASGSALLPAPIPVSGFHSERPGQAQRQLTASLGVKTEPAPTAVKQIADKASAFRKDSGKPVEVDVVYHADSPYNAFRNAVQHGDTEKAMEALQVLRKSHTDAQIVQAWRRSLTHPFTGSAAMEGKFRQSLSEDDRKLYDAAKKEKQETYRRFLTLWAQRGPK